MLRFIAAPLLCLCLAHPTAAAAGTVERFPGRILALDKADVSNAIASIVTEIHFVPGQRVQAGDLLFTLDASDFELALATERANVLSAEATFRSAQDDFERLRQLQERGSATGVQVLKAEVAQAFADAVRAENQARLKAALVDLERTRIKAPISGVISAPGVNVGAYVKKGRGALATIVQLDPVRVEFRVPYVERLETLELEDLHFPGSLLKRIELSLKLTDDWVYPETTKPTHVSATVEPETGALTLWAEMPNPRGQLRPGMEVTVITRTHPPE